MPFVLAAFSRNQQFDVILPQAMPAECIVTALTSAACQALRLSGNFLADFRIPFRQGRRRIKKSGRGEISVNLDVAGSRPTDCTSRYFGKRRGMHRN